jgi:hypothetical protein
MGAEGKAFMRRRLFGALFDSGAVKEALAEALN